jgi:1,4-dihydroxy-6-naphthoate synthase
MEPREICIGHSPDPDDAFMFYALTHGKLDTGGLTFKHVITDIETLNHRAVEGELEVTALSAHAYGYVMDKYALLPSGGSFGDRCGPIVVARKAMDVGELADDRIAVPGTMTSAYLLLKLLLMNFKFEVVPFDKITDAVLSGEVDAGLLIHEGQLTYEKFGLHMIVDLGAWWHADTGLPTPLGVNAVRKDLGKQLMRKLSQLLTDSIQYGLDHREEAVAYAMQYSRGMDAASTDRFIGMYVNPRTVNMGEKGREAVARLLTRGYHAALLPRPVHLEFVE